MIAKGQDVRIVALHVLQRSTGGPAGERNPSVRLRVLRASVVDLDQIGLLRSSRGGRASCRPLACLINEFSGSNGEEFPHHFRALKLGPLVGTHTWGGEVGSAPGRHLADGGVVNVPNYGAWEPNGSWAIEGPGLTPDFDVESDPNLWVKGVDPQLDKAVELLLEELKRHPRITPVQPSEPDKVKWTGRTGRPPSR